jgi:hypothetical protein
MAADPALGPGRKRRFLTERPYGLLCVALVPLGAQVLRKRLPASTGRLKVLSW